MITRVTITVPGSIEEHSDLVLAMATRRGQVHAVSYDVDNPDPRVPCPACNSADLLAVLAEFERDDNVIIHVECPICRFQGRLDVKE
jgi:cytidine deaminase